MGLFEPSAGDFWEMKEKEEKEKARKGAEERERAAAQAHRADAVRRTVANYEAGPARYRNVMDLSRNNIEDGARRLRRAGAFERGADAGLGFSGGDKALSPDARAGADFARRDTRPTDADGRRRLWDLTGMCIGAASRCVILTRSVLWCLPSRMRCRLRSGSFIRGRLRLMRGP